MLIKKLRNYHEPLLILTLSILIFSTIYNIYLLQGTARVVNYTGLVRGATQRVVKLEIVGSPDDRLIENLDDILAGLQNGGSKYELVKLDDVKYRNDLTELANYWQELKQEIAKSREGYYTNTKLLPMSENYFILADQVVSDAEVYSQKIADRLQLLEFCMIVNVVILLIILAIYQLQSRRMQSKYKKLSATAYVDVQTGLANKSSCEKKLQDQQWLDKHVGFLMFDMNNLKQVNDSLGHAAGDSMISNFARMLRLSVPDNQFIGRFGGDEFIVILSDSEVSDMNKIIATLNENIRAFNQGSNSIQISYAVGKAHTSCYVGNVTMKVLFEKDTFRLLGAQIVGFDGVDKRIDVIATAIRAGLKAYKLSELDLAYAPPYSSAKDPVNMAGFIIENIKNGIVKQWYYEDTESLQKDDNVTRLDTRTPAEYSRGHVEGFINIPVDELRERISELDSSKPVYVICQSGLRSYIATRILTGNGFDCYNFAGGFRFYDVVYNDKALNKKSTPCGMDN